MEAYTLQIKQSTTSFVSTPPTNSPSCSLSSEESDYCGAYFLVLSEQIAEMDEDILLQKHGYIRNKDNNINETAQGEIFIARKADKLVAIKKIPKDTFEHKECFQTQSGFIFPTDKNIVKEISILKSIAETDPSSHKFIIQYIDSFECETNYYLVEEYVEHSITLKQFVKEAHKYIKKNQLTVQRYKQCVKAILYELATTMHWLHSVHKCCHLDVNPGNILLHRDDICLKSDGSVYINPNIQIKLKDFGMAEKFEGSNDTFECDKQFLTADSPTCPNVENVYVYDGRIIDIWGYGMTMYYCYIGNYPYDVLQLRMVSYNEIREYFRVHNLLKFVNPKIVELLNMLLKVKANKRISFVDVLKHKLFSKFARKKLNKKRKKSDKKKSKINIHNKAKRFLKK